MEKHVAVVTVSDGAKLAVFVTMPDDEAACSAIPLLCLHGNGGDHGSFWQVVEAFGEERPIIAPDMRAQGVSTRGTARLSYELLAQDALQVMDALGVKRAVVLGYSDGGIEALIMARDCPAYVAGIVTMGANLTPEGVINDPPDAMEQDEAAYLALADELPRAAEQAQLLRLMIDEPHIEPESLDRIVCPATIMAGDADIIVPEETELIAKSIFASKLVIVPEAGHSLMKDAPEAVHAELREVFEQAH